MMYTGIDMYSGTCKSIAEVGNRNTGEGLVIIISLSIRPVFLIQLQLGSKWISRLDTLMGFPGLSR